MGPFILMGRVALRLIVFNSSSKAVLLTPEIVEYDDKTLAKPAFDLIFGRKTMTELGIILDFKNKMITINEIKLSM